MTSSLPPNLLRLFAPRPPLQYFPPVVKERKIPRFTGLAGYLNQAETHDVDYVPSKTMLEVKEKKIAEKKARIENRKKAIKDAWDPTKYEHATGDPYKTLFISNLAHETSEKQLRKTFEAYGDVKMIAIVMNNGKPKGYGFVEFERESAMKIAYKEASGLKLNGRRLLVDVERGRTVKGWIPKKLGGGLGKKRCGPVPKVVSMPTRSDPRPYSGGSRDGGPPRDGGGFRGGDRDERSGGGYRDDFRGSRGPPPPHRGLGFDRDRRGSVGVGGFDDRRGGGYRR